jgi:hypothetical protein
MFGGVGLVRLYSLMGHTKHIVMALFILNFLMVTCPVISLGGFKSRVLRFKLLLEFFSFH